MITYNKTSERYEKWGVDVTVDFFDDGKYVLTKTLRFDDQEQIDTDYDSRIVRALSNVQDTMDEERIPNAVYQIEELKKHFDTNITLTKEDYLELELTGKIPLAVAK